MLGVSAILLIFLQAPTTTNTALVLQACCGANVTGCTQFSRIEEMVGVACCASSAMNTFSQLCCGDSVRDRRSGTRFAELCCGDQALAYDQTCCEGIVHNVAGGSCCGRAVYDRDDRSILCCNRTLTRAGPHDVCCGSEPFDSGRTQICCGQKVYEKASFDSCCESNNGTFLPFRSETSFCCDTPQSKSGNRACCYLRNDAGGVKPAPYDKTSQCCTYPYRKITSMSKGSCVED